MDFIVFVFPVLPDWLCGLSVDLAGASLQVFQSLFYYLYLCLVSSLFLSTPLLTVTCVQFTFVTVYGAGARSKGRWYPRGPYPYYLGKILTFIILQKSTLLKHPPRKWPEPHSPRVAGPLKEFGKIVQLFHKLSKEHWPPMDLHALPPPL